MNIFNKNLIVLFHQVESLEWFESTIKTISRVFDFVSSKEIIDYYNGNLNLNGSCHITFDDGHKSIYHNAFPILKKYNLNASLFISPSILDGNQNYWWQKIDFYKEEKIYIELAKLLNIDKDKLKAMGLKPVEILKELDLKKINELLNILQSINKKNLEFLNINKEELIEMSNSGNFTIGSHTYNHPILANESNSDVDFEIHQSKEYLENLLDKEVDTFAYPNGITGLDFGSREIEICRSANIKIAYSCEVSYFSKIHSSLSVPRLEISTGSNLKNLTKIFLLKYLKNQFSSPNITSERLNFRKILNR